MQPVLNESIVKSESALNEKDNARMSVSTADLRAPLPPKVYKIDGMAPNGSRAKDGVRIDADRYAVTVINHGDDRAE